jgi:hypothetical protein
MVVDAYQGSRRATEGAVPEDPVVSAAWGSAAMAAMAVWVGQVG